VRLEEDGKVSTSSKRVSGRLKQKEQVRLRAISHLEELDAGRMSGIGGSSAAPVRGTCWQVRRWSRCARPAWPGHTRARRVRVECVLRRVGVCCYLSLVFRFWVRTLPKLHCTSLACLCSLLFKLAIRMNFKMEWWSSESGQIDGWEDWKCNGV
jgi:hypothetical protein